MSNVHIDYIRKELIKIRITEWVYDVFDELDHSKNRYSNTDILKKKMTDTFDPMIDDIFNEFRNNELYDNEYYKSPEGSVIHIIGTIDSITHGRVILAEGPLESIRDSMFKVIDSDDLSNYYTKITREEFMSCISSEGNC